MQLPFVVASEAKIHNHAVKSQGISGFICLLLLPEL